jgi:hypothetical protein
MPLILFGIVLGATRMRHVLGSRFSRPKHLTRPCMQSWICMVAPVPFQLPQHPPPGREFTRITVARHLGIFRPRLTSPLSASPWEHINGRRVSSTKLLTKHPPPARPPRWAFPSSQDFAACPNRRLSGSIMAGTVGALLYARMVTP